MSYYPNEHNAARKIMAFFVGRELFPSEIVHHIDLNPRNNHPSNLKIVSREEHGSLHAGNNRLNWKQRKKLPDAEITTFEDFRRYCYKQIVTPIKGVDF